MEKQEKTKAHCNICFGERNHEVLYTARRDLIDPYDDEVYLNYGESFETIQCCGCESIKVRHQSWHDAEIDLQGDTMTHTTYYPPATSRREPEWMSFIAEYGTTEILFKEVYIALRNNCSHLAAMGVRSIIEHIMIEAVGDNGTFKDNLKEFGIKGYISTKQGNVLESAIEAGNATTHRGFHPFAEDLSTLLDIVEHLYEAIYIHPHSAESLKGKIPPRPPRKK